MSWLVHKYDYADVMHEIQQIWKLTDNQDQTKIQVICYCVIWAKLEDFLVEVADLSRCTDFHLFQNWFIGFSITQNGKGKDLKKKRNFQI